MANFRDWTVSEICMQVPGARNLIAKHFGPEGITTASSAKLRDLAQRKGVDVSEVVRELNQIAPKAGG